MLSHVLELLWLSVCRVGVCWPDNSQTACEYPRGLQIALSHPLGMQVKPGFASQSAQSSGEADSPEVRWRFLQRGMELVYHGESWGQWLLCKCEVGLPPGGDIIGQTKGVGSWSHSAT